MRTIKLILIVVLGIVVFFLYPPLNPVHKVRDVPIPDEPKPVYDPILPVLKRLYILKRMELDINEKKDYLAKEEHILKHAQDILKKNKQFPFVDIAGRRFSWDEVKQDALSHQANCEILRKEIAEKEKMFNELKKACKQGELLLKKAIKERHSQTNIKKEDLRLN